MSNSVKCPCGKTFELSDDVHRGMLWEARVQSGFIPVLTHEMKTIWLCPYCYDKAHAAALVIMDVVKDDSLYFPNLLRTKKGGEG